MKVHLVNMVQLVKYYSIGSSVFVREDSPETGVNMVSRNGNTLNMLNIRN